MYRVIGLALAVLFLAVVSAQAECCGDGMKGAAKMGYQDMVKVHLDQMTKDLKLTGEQKVQLETIMKEKMAQKERIAADKEAAMMAMQAEFKTKVSAVLTDEQKKQWESDMQKGDMKAGMKGKCSDCKKGKKCARCQSKKEKRERMHQSK